MVPPAPETEPDSGHTIDIRFDDENQGKNFEFRFDAGRKGGIGAALWVILAAGLLILSEVRSLPADLWGCLWTSGLLVFGLFGLYPRFSLLRLGCALLGGYNLLSWWMPVPTNEVLWLAFFLLLIGLGILTKSLSKKEHAHFHVNPSNMVNEFNIDGSTFHCSTAFSEDDQHIQLPWLSGGKAEVSFGELTLDLRGCEEFSPDCTLDLECAFGRLVVLVPRGCKAEWTAKKAFANLDVKGTPDPSASAAIRLNCDVSFGQITIRYL